MEGSFASEEDINNLYMPGGRGDVAKAKPFLRYLLITFLVLVLLGGLSILGIGIWAHEAEYGSKALSALIGVTLYSVDSYLLIGAGAAIVFIEILGFCGFFIRYRCIMGLHLGLLAFMSVMLFVAGILGYVLIGELESNVKTKLEDTIEQDYGQEGADEITSAWDRVQSTFQCCGAYGDINSSTSWKIYSEKSRWFTGNGSYVPSSCCDSRDIDACTGRTDTPNAPPRHGPPVTSSPSAWGYTLYTTGCFDKLESYLRRTGIVIGTSAITIGVFMLVELMLSVCLYRTLPRSP